MNRNEDHAKGNSRVEFGSVILTSKSEHDSQADEDLPLGDRILSESVAETAIGEPESHLWYDQAHADDEAEDYHDRIEVFIPVPRDSLNAHHYEHERFNYHKDI